MLEALYDLERPRHHWFRGVLESARSLDRGRGVGMVLYDVSGSALRIEALDGINVAPENLKVGSAAHAQPDWTDDIVKCYRTVVCATLDEHVPDLRARAALRELYQPLGIRDQILINGANHSGFGCSLFVFSRTALHLRAPERELLTRLATHLATAYRLQRRLGQTSPGAADEAVAAVLSAGGRMEHAASPAISAESRRVLGDAVRLREWARTRAGRTDPHRATGAWKPLIGGRWSLVDTYERGGRRYITACENAPAPIALHLLSPRELQVVSMADLGHANKVIAYELGLVHSTVRVLLARAASKLAVRSRAELIAKFRELQHLAERASASLREPSPAR